MKLSQGNYQRLLPWKQEEGQATIALSRSTTQNRYWKWLGICSTLLLIISVITFRMRRYSGILGAPIDLPPRQYVFADHPELRAFNEETTKRWEEYSQDHWWSMEWKDPSGNRLVQGIDMLHKLHCLVSLRDEFTMLATDEERHVYFNARNSESLTRRMHIKHCLDFIRQDVLCAADATVEPLGHGYTRSNGLGTEHQCRDWDGILTYARSKHYFPEWLKGTKTAF